MLINHNLGGCGVDGLIGDRFVKRVPDTVLHVSTLFRFGTTTETQKSRSLLKFVVNLVIEFGHDIVDEIRRIFSFELRKHLHVKVGNLFNLRFLTDEGGAVDTYFLLRYDRRRLSIGSLVECSKSGLIHDGIFDRGFFFRLSFPEETENHLLFPEKKKCTLNYNEEQSQSGHFTRRRCRRYRMDD